MGHDVDHRAPGGRRHVQIIAEAGMNHDGSFGNAVRLVEVAVECGADSIKFQLHIAEAETVRDAPNPPYFSGESRHDYFTRTAFSFEQWQRLKVHCEQRGVEFLCSPFSLEAVEQLERLGVARYKIPSGEVTNLPLLERIAQTAKPVLLSSGMSNWDELDAAVAIFRRAGNPLTVLQCTSEYPCAYEHVGLNLLQEMAARYKVAVGLSDHTLTPYAAYAAATLGASVIEKHVTLSREMYGSDAKHSLEPKEFAELVQGIRAMAILRACPVNKNDLSHVRHMKTIFEKSLVAGCAIPAGATITAEAIQIKKPGTGIPARRYAEVMGRQAARDIPADHVLQEEDVKWTRTASANGRTVRVSRSTLQLSRRVQGARTDLRSLDAAHGAKNVLRVSRRRAPARNHTEP